MTPVGEIIRYQDGELHPLVAALPYYQYVPKEPKKHLEWRVEVLEKCLDDAAFRQGIIDCCSEDFLFWVNLMCIAAGTPVVTDRGLVPIEDVTPLDKVWDGDQWVSQGGAIFKGHRDVISAYGIELTPDHEVMTDHGWQPADSGYDRAEVRTPPGDRIRRQIQENQAGWVEVPVRLRGREGRGGEPPANREHKELRVRQGREGNSRDGRDPNAQFLDFHDTEVRESVVPCLRVVRWARDKCLRPLAGFLHQLPGGHGRATAGNVARQDRQRRQLLSKELPMGDPKAASQQHQEKSRDSDLDRYVQHRRAFKADGDHAERDSPPDQPRPERGRTFEATPTRLAPVYDLVNCGPKRAFTVVGADGRLLLVHNCWIVEPRDESGDSLLPFNTWPHQDPVMAAMAYYLGRKRDIVGDKSRAQGASWMVVALYVWGILFRKRKSFGIMSKDEDTGDDHKDPNSVGWKIDFILRNLPPWLRPPGIEVGGPHRSTSNHTWYNPLTDSTIKIFAANKTSGRGGRFTSFFLDEAAFFGQNRDQEALSNLQQTCFNRIVLSTPNGTEIEFHRLVVTPSIWLKVVLDWEDNPSQNKGKYTSREGKLEILDKDYAFPEGYKFILDGITRSPWFDHECARANWNMVEINRELRRDHGGSKTRPFPPEALNCANRYLRDPFHRGNLRFEKADPSDLSSLKYRDDSSGNLCLWFHPNEDGFPPPGQYVVACDIGAGTGSSASSNSVIQVFSGIGEQMAEFASNTVSPPRLARLAVALCYWFGRGRPDVYLNWEKTGPLGTQFSSAVKSLQYPNLYYYVERTRRGPQKRTKPGWHTSKTAATLEPLVNALSDEAIVIRSHDLARECGEYEFGTGDWVHPGAVSARDAADQGFNHGDRAVAAGVAIISLLDRGWLPNAKPKKVIEEPPIWNAPYNSLAGRYKERQRRKEEQENATSCVW